MDYAKSLIKIWASILYVATKTLPFLAHVRGSQGEFATPLTHAFAPSVFIENS